MENNQRNSRKRLNSLILLVAFTAVMLIVSTYAWFSTQKNVTLSNLYGKVNVAEGLQISLDGSVWVNSIDFSDFDQSTTSWKLKSGVDQSTYFDAGTTSPSFQYPAGQPESGDGDPLISNVIPTEFLPVSTTGYGSDGIGQSLLKMYSGNVENNKLLSAIEPKTEESASGYFAFDLFVWNSSAEGMTTDILKLDETSTIACDNANTGIENTVRVGFALYNNDGSNISTAVTRSQSDVIGGTSTGKTIKDVAIWEPNANKHTNTIVNTNNALTLSAADVTAYGLDGEGGTYNTTRKYRATDLLPTYALTAASTTATYQGKQTAGADTPGDTSDDNYENVTGINDIYNWDGGLTNSKLAKQYTLQTTDSTFAGEINSVNLISTGKSANVITDTEGTKTFDIAASQYHKIRVYIWIEGQDPDCINAASLGGGLTIDIGFSKPGSDSSTSTSAS